MIPKTVHYCWLSGDPYPELIDKCIQSWKKYLNGYQFVLWNKTKIESIHNEWLKQTVELKKYAFATDFIRIYALLKFGGIYLDTDVELVGSLDPFLAHDFFIGVEYNNDFEPAVFGAVKGHPWLNDLFDYYNKRSFIKRNGKLDERPLPGIFNEMAEKRYGFVSKGKRSLIKNEDIVMYPYDYFSPKNIYSQQVIRTENTVAIHHFSGSWLQNNVIDILKRIIHQNFIRLGGRSFHNYFVRVIRKLF